MLANKLNQVPELRGPPSGTSGRHDDRMRLELRDGEGWRDDDDGKYGSIKGIILPK